MASISKLSVRGVRSFSPDDAEQVLEFYTPLTVIVGENGCGKTTIIESLKFAVCGSLPPGKTAGQAFVHDPRSIGSTVVKANVKLRFSNTVGKPMVVIRSMEVQAQKKKLAFKQLDGTLRATDQNGLRVSMSHKCTELDRQIPLILGCSKAILENVVFCHQEDASWPLQDSSVLKKKFDEIFDSARYSKALEVFAKCKKEYTLKAKDHKAEVNEYRAHRHAAKGHRKEVQEKYEELEELEDELESGRQALQENEEEQERVEGLLEKADVADNKVDSKRQDILMERQALSMQRSHLAEDLTDHFNEKELTEQLRTFDIQKDSHADKKHEVEEKFMTCKRELKIIQGEQKELQSEVDRLCGVKQSHTKNLRKRYEKMCEIGQSYGLEAMLTPITQNSQLGSATSGRFSSTQDTMYSLDASQHGEGEVILDIPEEDIKQYFRAVENKKKELQEQLSTQKSNISEQEDELNNDLSDLKGKAKAIESKRKDLFSEATETKNELDQIRQQSQSGQKFRKSNLEDAKKNALEAATKREEANSDPRRNDIPIEIQSIANKVEDLNKKIKYDTEVQKDLRSTSDMQRDIKQLNAQCETELEELEEKISAFKYQLEAYRISSIPSELPGSDVDKRGVELKKVIGELNEQITGEFANRERELEKNRKSVADIENAISKKQGIVESGVESIRSHRQEMTAIKTRIEQVRQVVEDLRSFEARDEEISTPLGITADNPKELASYLMKRIKHIDDHSTEDIPPDMIKKIMKKLFKLATPPNKEFVCPCCERGLTEDSDIIRFQKSMKLLSGVNSVLIKVDERTKIAQTKYKEWCRVTEENRDYVLRYLSLEKELVTMGKNVDDIESTLRNHRREVEDKKSEIQSNERDVKDCRELCDASRIWVEASKRIATARDTVHQKEAYLCRSQNSDREQRDLNQVEAELVESNQKIADYNEKTTNLNNELATINQRVSDFSNTAIRLEDHFKKMESKYEEQLKREEREVELNKRFAERKREQDKLSEQIATLNQRIEAKESKKKRAKKLFEEEEERISSTLTAFRNDVTVLQNIVDSIEEYEKSNSGDEIQRLEAKIKILTKKDAEKNEEIDRMEPDLQRLAKMVDDQELQRKNFEDNIKVIRSQQKLKESEKELARIEEEASELTEGREDLKEYQGRLRQRNDKLITRKARLEGKRGAIIDTVRGLKRKLSQSEYKNVEEQFRVASIKQDTTEMAVSDIGKYMTALDNALHKYHSIKVTQINSIIRDLWNLTYKGEDIRNIEIVSGKDAGGRSSRSYNYRVVMSKGSGTMMDMRGRCSAGQRVLASIVIRLALAETFCVKFGCISLDEPTVNLDYKNKKGLAVALAQIIAARSQQINFQLVLITHDEEFVLMMKNELSMQSNVSMPEKYFQIRREEGMDGKFYSKIDAIDWEELL